MAQSFSYDLSVPGAPSEAQGRLKGPVTERLRVAGKMRLASEDSSSLAFRPSWSFPVFLAASRMISGEGVTLGFSPGDDGATKIAVSGKVGGSARKLASREFWAETLQAT
ncbi:MAG TPA: hypothetical protein VMF57_09195 [Solirubrobacteraceae bacterium]|nr:hypothetical protein [Solirubrobacteraceae bacterium]